MSYTGYGSSLLIKTFSTKRCTETRTPIFLQGLFYISSGFVQPDFTNASAFYHRVEAGAKFKPDSPHVLSPMYVTTPLSYSWRRPARTETFQVEFGRGEKATHYRAASVNIKAADECCSLVLPSTADSAEHAPPATYNTSCSCPSTSSSDNHMMLAIPVHYFPALQDIISISHRVFSTYRHDLWQHEQASPS